MNSKKYSTEISKLMIGFWSLMISPMLSLSLLIE